MNFQVVNQDEEVIEEDDMAEERYVAPVQFAGTSVDGTGGTEI